MSTFSYTALGSGGKIIAGELDAQNRTEAYRKLERENLQPVSLELKGQMEGDSAIQAAAQMALGPLLLTHRQIVQFTEELSDLLEAGLRLEPALQIMEEREELSSLKYVVTALRRQVVEGTTFSSALKVASSSFGDLYCNLVAAGEVSGALPKILRRQGIYLAAMGELQSRVLQALVYPAFIMGVGFLLLCIFMTVLVPKLTLLFTKTGGSLPFLTRLLIQTSGFFAHYWWAILGVIVLLGAAFWRLVQMPAGRRWWDENKLKIPVVGGILSARFYAQFSQTLSTLVISGVPLLNGLRLMSAATPNVHLRGLLDRMVERVADGISFSKAMKLVGNFPPIFMDVVRVGEQTGEIGLALERVAVRYDKELNQKIQRLTSLIQPAVIVLMALLVGVVAYAIMTGIFQAISGLRIRH